METQVTTPTTETVTTEKPLETQVVTAELPTGEGEVETAEEVQSTADASATQPPEETDSLVPAVLAVVVAVAGLLAVVKKLLSK